MFKTKTLSSNGDATGVRTEVKWDVLLPSSPDEEQLTPILTNHARNNSNINQGGPVLPSEEQHDFTNDPVEFNAYDFSNDSLEIESFLSFNDRFLNRSNTGMTLEEPMSATSLTNKSLNSASRKSTGIADMSSQLLSPVLTTQDSPSSLPSGETPIVTHKVLGGGYPEDYSSQGTSGYSNDTYQTPADYKTPTNPSSLSNKEYPMPGTGQIKKKRRGSETGLQTGGEEPFENEQSAIVDVSRHGMDPNSRSQIKGTKIMSLTQQANKQAVDMKNNDVSKWLSTHELTAADHHHLSQATRSPIGRRRSRSTGDRIVLPPQIPTNDPISEEHSEDDDDDSSDLESYHAVAPSNFTKSPGRPTIDAIQTVPQPTDASPWVDPIRFPSMEGSVGQPATAAEAMMKYRARARDLETASRAATWGTQRRMSDPDGTAWTHTEQEAHRIFGHGGLLSRLSLTKEMEEEYKGELRNLVEHAKEKAARWWPKRESFYRPAPPIRSPSNHSAASPTPSIKSKRESTHDLTESIKARFHRYSGAKKPSASELDLNAVTQGLGSSSPTSTHSPPHSPTHTITALAHAAREKLSRHSSKDDTYHLASLWRTQSGGPPIAYPKLNQSPPTKSEAVFQTSTRGDTITGVAPVAEPKPINTGFHSDRQLPIPTLEGFLIDARRRLPNLEPFLADRLAMEQRRRYKKLVELKSNHAKLVAVGACPSGPFCIEGESHIEYFDAKAQKDTGISATGIGMAGDEDGDEMLDEGFLNENNFPSGMPSTPAKKLPAQFECPLCFQVKKFAKPSDWSKHVHEDLQPFTCTFADCPDPKSFKRKADWVRHENERHRELEWWICEVGCCEHKCNRRDNFVQHLSREHQIEEPKTKIVKADNRPAVRGPAKSKGKGANDTMPMENTVASLVVRCRHETRKQATDEPCRLCGRTYNTFKRLTADSAKHMEDLSLPVLELVRLKEVTAETIISPIEAKPPQLKTQSSPFTPSANVSPYNAAVLDVNTTMPDLPAAFAPLPTTTTFQPAPFSNVVWSNANTSTAPAMMYPDQMNSWALGNNQFGGGVNSGDNVHGGGVSSGEQNSDGMFGTTTFVQQPLLTHGSSFQQHHISTNLTQGMMNMRYQQPGDTSLMEMNISPGYTGHFGVGETSHAPQHSPLVGYGGQTHGLYEQQQPPPHNNESISYDSRGDQIYLQGVQHHGIHHVSPQQQQQQHQTQPGSTQFFPSSY
ncbi:MAG: hypothetical protein GOMPHAMPRED_002582 [Gomphillus americanus]|uniref:C2H2-type domain-containing protein n=1 Tax=Gomphillus americanus TaxID=1940652 RepID=A0A8H3FFE7_9LECA|nr:MAG: hypothetical protein GOMPHAMPRED_002582 [Gomphillus americanus]